jgi:sensor histidine kinase YesM
MMTFKLSKTFIYTYGLLLGLAILGFVIRYLRFPAIGLNTHLSMFAVSLVMITFIWNFFNWMDSYLNKVYPFERSIPVRITVQIIIGLIFILLVRMIIFWYAEPRLPFRLDDMFRFSTYALYVMLSVILNVGFFASNFLRLWKNSIQRAERLEREKSQVQFDNLKNQLNPHFLFNALTSLNSLIFEDQQLASDFLQNLSKVFRYVLQHKEKGLVPLQVELEFMERYVFLLKTRFGEALHLTITTADSAMTKEIVPVTLQLLIENAIKHNTMQTTRPLFITISADPVYLTVTNNVQLRNQIEGSNKQGLDNLKSLYNFISPRPVQIITNETEFTVKVPLI